MIVDASRRRVEFYWYWLILGLQPIGAKSAFEQLMSFRAGGKIQGERVRPLSCHPPR